MTGRANCPISRSYPGAVAGVTTGAENAPYTATRTGGTGMISGGRPTLT